MGGGGNGDVNFLLQRRKKAVDSSTRNLHKLEIRTIIMKSGISYLPDVRLM
jgi:hypothetical protein